MSRPISVKISKSDNPNKKLKAVFTLENGRTKTINFGSAGMSDFTIHKDVERRDRYDARHKVRENWNDPMTAGALSKWILWNKPTRQESITDFKRKFNLK